MTVKPGWARKRPAAARRPPSTAKEPRGEPPSGDRSIWDLNRDEQRTMMITVVGGLGSIILGVAVIAVALKLVHTMNAHPAGAKLGREIYFWALAGCLVVLTGYFVVEKPKSPRSRISRGWQSLPPTSKFLLVGSFLLMALYGLALLGYAAGVK